jgi:hypothetical protein
MLNAFADGGGHFQSCACSLWRRLSHWHSRSPRPATWALTQRQWRVEALERTSTWKRTMSPMWDIPSSVIHADQPAYNRRHAQGIGSGKQSRATSGSSSFAIFRISATTSTPSRYGPISDVAERPVVRFNAHRVTHDIRNRLSFELLQCAISDIDVQQRVSSATQRAPGPARRAR